MKAGCMTDDVALQGCTGLMFQAAEAVSGVLCLLALAAGAAESTLTATVGGQRFVLMHPQISFSVCKTSNTAQRWRFPIPASSLVF